MKRCTNRSGSSGAATWLLPLAALLLSACVAQVQQQPAAPGTPVTKPEAQAPSKGDPEQRFEAALQLMKDKKVQDAKDAFTSLAQDFPQYAGPLNDLGVLQALSKQHAQAIASFEKATAANAKDDFAWDWLGILYREGGEYIHAEQAYLKAIALKPDNAIAHLNLGILYDAYLSRPQDALAQYRIYQKITGTDGRPIVTAWIDELQEQQTPANAAPTAAPAAGRTAPTAGTVTPVEHTP
jgi:tetratricopeptide (TPR) repeat protein